MVDIQSAHVDIMQTVWVMLCVWTDPHILVVLILEL